MKPKRQSVKCSLCGERFMSELTPEATAAKHAETCTRFAAVLIKRMQYHNSNLSNYAKGLDTLGSELYQMRALYLRFDAVSGHLNNQVPCDARCTGARGHNCECQCGGAHHGEQNAISHGMVAA